jgi:hypothetical protein
MKDIYEFYFTNDEKLGATSIHQFNYEIGGTFLG